MAVVTRGLVVLRCEVGTGVVVRGEETPSLGCSSGGVGGLHPGPRLLPRPGAQGERTRGARQPPRRQRNHLELKESKEM